MCYVKAPRAGTAAAAPLQIDPAQMSLWADLPQCGLDAPSDLAALDALSSDNLNVWLDLLAASAPAEPQSIKAEAPQINPQTLFPSPPDSVMTSPSDSLRSATESLFSAPQTPFDSAAAAVAMGIPITIPQMSLFPPMTAQTPIIQSNPLQHTASVASSIQMHEQPKPAQSPKKTAKSRASAKRKSDDASDSGFSMSSNSSNSPAKSGDSDESLLAIKRARNNEAARRSRERKMRRLEELEKQVASLEAEKSDLHVRLAVLDNERATWMNRERELVHRVLSLESQLGESHRALMQVGMVRPNGAGSKTTKPISAPATCKPSAA